MAGGKSTYLINKILEHNVGKTSFTMPANVYLALCTSTPTAASTGSTIVEANYTTYVRKQILNTDWGSAGTVAGQISNANQLVFTGCTAGSSVINSFALVDASSGGNVLYWGTITSKTIDSSNTPATVGVGALIISEA